MFTRGVTGFSVFAGGDTRHVVRPPLSGASEAPGAVGGQRRGTLLCQDVQPAPLPVSRLLHSKTFHTWPVLIICISFHVLFLNVVFTKPTVFMI